MISILLSIEIFGTVLSLTFKSNSSAPSAIAWQDFLPILMQNRTILVKISLSYLLFKF